MSEISTAAADQRQPPALAASHGAPLAKPPLWLWGAAIALQVACAAALTNFTFFFLDDYLFLGEARSDPFNLAYLRFGLYGHFSPISRALDRLLVVLAPGSWLLAHGIELGMYACALAAFAALMRAILGNGWIAFILTLLFGQSLFLIRLLFWWTATANILPATVFMLAGLACYLRWREGGSPILLAGCFASFVIALLDYETALLFPAYVAVIGLVAAERRPGPRAWAETLWRERWAWVGLVVLEAAALVNFYSNYPSLEGMRPSIAQLLHYLEIAFFQTFIPALLGIRYPQATAVTVLAAAVVGGAAAVTLYLRPRAWRCLAAFVVVFLITMLPVGLNRISTRGVGVAGVLYYQQAAQFMFFVLAAFAISPRWSGRRTERARVLAGAGALNRRRPLALRRPAAGLLAAGAVAAAAAYGALYVTSTQGMEGQVWQAKRDSTFVHSYLASDSRVRAAIGAEPVLIDLRIPRHFLPQTLWPNTTYAGFFGLFNAHLRVDELARRLYVVNRNAQLVAVRFVVSRRGLIDQARVGSVSAPVAKAASAAAASAAAARPGCAPAAPSQSWVLVPFARYQKINARSLDLAYVLRVRFAIPATTAVAAEVLRRPAGQSIGTVTQTWVAGSGGQYIPLHLTGPASEVAFQLPARACVTELELGALQFAGSGSG